MIFPHMPITDLLERNAKLYGDEVALVEINPEQSEPVRVTWKEYALIQPTSEKTPVYDFNNPILLLFRHLVIAGKT